MQASLNRLEAEASGGASSRSMHSPRGLEGAIRLRDLASPVQPRSGHSPRAPSPARGQVPQEVVRRLEEHDDHQVRVCMLESWQQQTMSTIQSVLFEVIMDHNFLKRETCLRVSACGVTGGSCPATAHPS